MRLSGEHTWLVQRTDLLPNIRRSVTRNGDQDYDVPRIQRKRRKLAAECARFVLAAETEVVDDAQTHLKVGIPHEFIMM